MQDDVLQCLEDDPVKQEWNEVLWLAHEISQAPRDARSVRQQPPFHLMAEFVPILAIEIR
jgi:hypothetical protein